MTKTAFRLFVIVLFFGSCTKINFSEYMKHPGQLRFCNIATWTDLPGDEGGEARTNIFTYDANGNPLSVTSDQGTGSGSHFFTYDNKQRLTKYEYEFVRTKVFHYEDERTLADSATVTDLLDRVFSEVYTYDSRGRIIKSVLTLTSSPFEEDNFTPEIKDYVYLNDDIGSIILDGVQQNPDVTYSSMPSVYMTNKVWKFVNQNYSKHAVSGAMTSNKIGLPLTFEPDEYEFPFLDIRGAGSTVSYQCE